MAIWHGPRKNLGTLFITLGRSWRAPTRFTEWIDLKAALTATALTIQNGGSSSGWLSTN